MSSVAIAFPEVRGIESDYRTRRELAVNLRIQVGSLGSIARIAPYLGLAGTCLGLLSLFDGFAMEKHTVEVMLVSKAAAALLTTAAGILVAVPASCLYNYLQTRIDLLENENRGPIGGSLPLKKRFSGFPAFPLIAAPCLAMAVAGFMSFASFRGATGLTLEVATVRCEHEADGRSTVLRITNGDGLLLNNERQDWDTLASRLAEVYSFRRAHRILYLSANDGVSFQTVAHVIDIAQSMSITTKLITPTVMNSPCSDPSIPKA